MAPLHLLCNGFLKSLLIDEEKTANDNALNEEESDDSDNNEEVQSDSVWIGQRRLRKELQQCGEHHRIIIKRMNEKGSGYNFIKNKEM